MTESTRESGDVDLDLPGLGLLVREPYISFILAHQKRWEIRGTRTKHRGRLALIRSKSGLIVGECKIIDCEGEGSGDSGISFCIRAFLRGA